MTFQKELEQLLNKHSKDNECNTPDFILAEYLMECLQSFNKANRLTTQWKRVVPTSTQPEASVDDLVANRPPFPSGQIEHENPPRTPRPKFPPNRLVPEAAIWDDRSPSAQR